MTLKLCQGPDCHTYTTKDRLKGPAGSKTFQTRRKSYLLYGNFCSLRCTNDWLDTFVDRAINHFGRTTEAKHLTEENAWEKSFEWDREYENRTYVLRNAITKETRPLTEAQYDDINYTLNER